MFLSKSIIIYSLSYLTSNHVTDCRVFLYKNAIFFVIDQRIIICSTSLFISSPPCRGIRSIVLAHDD